MAKALRTASRRHVAIAAATLAALAIGAVGIAQAVGGGSETPPAKPLAQALSGAADAPDVQGITARIHFTNQLLPAGAMPEGAGSPMITGADGRLWLTGDGRLRLELQSDAGDAQILSDGRRFSVYDGSSNTVYTGRLPAPRDDAPKPERRLTLDDVNRGLARLGEMWNLSGATPGNTAGQPSYTLRIAPKDDGGLLGAAEAAWDAARGVPLRAAVYARGQKSPVLELAVTEISYGAVSAADVTAQPPAGARTVELNPPAGRDAQGRPTEVRGLAAVQRHVGFSVSAPDALAGLPRREVRLVRLGSDNGALATYGQGLGAMFVLERKAGAKAANRFGDPRLPAVDIGGDTGSELATPLGTIVTAEHDGVSYTVAGSVPPPAAESAARGLK